MPKIYRSLLAVALVSGLLLPGPRPAHAGSLAANGVVGDGTPASCTYAELILEMNSPGYITFACGAAPYTIILTQPGGVPPQAGHSTTLDGGGRITLSAANVADTRLFDVAPSTSLTLTHMTLLNATTATMGGGALHNRGHLVLDDVVLAHSGAQGVWGGGGIYNQAGTLLVRNSTLQENYSAGGSAIFNEVGALATLDGSTFLSNTVANGYYGGAISNSGILTITASHFTGNVLTLVSPCPVACGGGAIANLTSAGVTISATTFTRNSTNYDGGAILNLGYVFMENSTLSDNQAAKGGALANRANDYFFLVRDTLVGNHATANGGGLYSEHNGPFGTVGLTDVAIQDNTAANGGGFYNWLGAASLNRVTLSANAAGADGGGLLNNDQITMTNVTLSGNQAANGGGLLNAYHATLTQVTMSGNTGGGIQNYSFGGNQLNLTDVLLAGNSPLNCSGAPPQAPTFNLSTDATCFTAGNGNHVSTPQALSPLANNGGFTRTHLPAPNSPAIDNGQCIGGLTIDQRGLPRLVGAGCDIGAVERQSADFGWYVYLPLTRR